MALLWDPLKKHPSVILSAGDTIATTSQTLRNCVLGTTSKTSGIVQFEVSTAVSGAWQTNIGIANSTFDYTALTYLGRPIAASYQSSGAYFTSTGYYHIANNTAAVVNDYIYSPESLASPVIMQVVLDLDSPQNTIKIYQNGILKATDNLPSGETWYPAVMCGSNAFNEIKGNDFDYAIPGAEPWVAEPIPVDDDGKSFVTPFTSGFLTSFTG